MISTTDWSANALDQKTDTTLSVLNQAEKDKWDVINGIRARERKVELFKDRRRWFALGAVALALALSVVLPRFMASTPSTCAVIGGSWQTTTTGVDVCVFYRPWWIGMVLVVVSELKSLVLYMC